MQGTRVTRTQYGFRTLQESSAKMCLKVTGYPLPDITWYKDDVQLHEDERHTFYSDEDGFFAMTIDPVQVSFEIFAKIFLNLNIGYFRRGY